MNTTTPLHAVLVRPEIPHNTGAIGRTCVALGCDLALVRPLRFALSDQYVRRAGLDYWQYLSLAVYDNWDDFPALTFWRGNIQLDFHRKQG